MFNGENRLRPGVFLLFDSHLNDLRAEVVRELERSHPRHRFRAFSDLEGSNGLINALAEVSESRKNAKKGTNLLTSRGSPDGYYSLHGAFNCFNEGTWWPVLIVCLVDWRRLPNGQVVRFQRDLAIEERALKLLRRLTEAVTTQDTLPLHSFEHNNTKYALTASIENDVCKDPSRAIDAHSPRDAAFSHEVHSSAAADGGLNHVRGESDTEISSGVENDSDCVRGAMVVDCTHTSRSSRTAVPEAASTIRIAHSQLCDVSNGEEHWPEGGQPWAEQLSAVQTSTDSGGRPPSVPPERMDSKSDRSTGPALADSDAQLGAMMEAGLSRWCKIMPVMIFGSELSSAGRRLFHRSLEGIEAAMAAHSRLHRRLYTPLYILTTNNFEHLRLALGTIITQQLSHLYAALLAVTPARSPPVSLMSTSRPLSDDLSTSSIANLYVRDCLARIKAATYRSMLKEMMISDQPPRAVKVSRDLGTTHHDSRSEPKTQCRDASQIIWKEVVPSICSLLKFLKTTTSPLRHTPLSLQLISFVFAAYSRDLYLRIQEDLGHHHAQQCYKDLRGRATTYLEPSTLTEPVHENNANPDKALKNGRTRPIPHQTTLKKHFQDLEGFKHALFESVPRAFQWLIFAGLGVIHANLSRICAATPVGSRFRPESGSCDRSAAFRSISPSSDLLQSVAAAHSFCSALIVNPSSRTCDFNGRPEESLKLQPFPPKGLPDADGFPIQEATYELFVGKGEPQTGHVSFPVPFYPSSALIPQRLVLFAVGTAANTLAAIHGLRESHSLCEGGSLQFGGIKRLPFILLLQLCDASLSFPTIRSCVAVYLAAWVSNGKFQERLGRFVARTVRRKLRTVSDLLGLRKTFLQELLNSFRVGTESEGSGDQGSALNRGTRWARLCAEEIATPGANEAFEDLFKVLDECLRSRAGFDFHTSSTDKSNDTSRQVLYEQPGALKLLADEDEDEDETDNEDDDGGLRPPLIESYRSPRHFMAQIVANRSSNTAAKLVSRRTEVTLQYEFGLDAWPYLDREACKFELWPNAPNFASEWQLYRRAPPANVEGLNESTHTLDSPLVQGAELQKHPLEEQPLNFVPVRDGRQMEVGGAVCTAFFEFQGTRGGCDIVCQNEFSDLMVFKKSSLPVALPLDLRWVAKMDNGTRGPALSLNAYSRGPRSRSVGDSFGEEPNDEGPIDILGVFLLKSKLVKVNGVSAEGTLNHAPAVETSRCTDCEEESQTVWTWSDGSANRRLASGRPTLLRTLLNGANASVEGRNEQISSVGRVSQADFIDLTQGTSETPEEGESLMRLTTSSTVLFATFLRRLILAEENGFPYFRHLRAALFQRISRLGGLAQEQRTTDRTQSTQGTALSPSELELLHLLPILKVRLPGPNGASWRSPLYASVPAAVILELADLVFTSLSLPAALRRAPNPLKISPIELYREMRFESVNDSPFVRLRYTLKSFWPWSLPVRAALSFVRARVPASYISRTFSNSAEPRTFERSHVKSRYPPLDPRLLRELIEAENFSGPSHTPANIAKKDSDSEGWDRCCAGDLVQSMLLLPGIEKELNVSLFSRPDDHVLTNRLVEYGEDILREKSRRGSPGEQLANDISAEDDMGFRNLPSADPPCMKDSKTETERWAPRVLASGDVSLLPLAALFAPMKERESDKGDSRPLTHRVEGSSLTATRSKRGLPPRGAPLTKKCSVICLKVQLVSAAKSSLSLPDAKLFPAFCHLGRAGGSDRPGAEIAPGVPIRSIIL